MLGVKPAMMVEAVKSTPDGGKATAMMTVFPLANFYIKVFEPRSPNGPFADHLAKYGMSIQDAQIQVAGDIGALREALEKKGGR